MSESALVETGLLGSIVSRDGDAFFVVAVFIDPNRQAGGVYDPILRVLLRAKDGRHLECLASEVVYLPNQSAYNATFR